mmetsp:Transcript_56425/g.114968  ORF Transcript_56425/g.114968 Transcript_56425/m.114968 type:complete len:113 (+) Transcript_56425:595-933(+)
MGGDSNSGGKLSGGAGGTCSGTGGSDVLPSRSFDGRHRAKDGFSRSLFSAGCEAEGEEDGESESSDRDSRRADGRHWLKDDLANGVPCELEGEGICEVEDEAGGPRSIDGRH